MSRVAVAMSGGVDSSVAALLLKEGGEPVVGLSMRLHEEATRAGPAARCCGGGDLLDARQAAETIGIPFYVLNLEREFRRDVIDDFVATYRAGRTPVPCVRCNTGPKFRHLAERARGLGAERIATGHYARTARDAGTGRVVLRRARDGAKDQSYFLFDLTQEQLAAALFPIGDLDKPRVRAIAAERGLPNAGKPESQDICFVPDGDYRAFVRREAGDAGPPGEIVDREGRVLGTHSGLAAYTVGQRRGLGVAASRALYVVALDRDRNRLVVGDEGEQYRATLLAEEANWVSIAEPARPLEAEARIRSTHQGAAATVEPLPGRRFRVTFREPQRAVTPGQAVVLYDGDRVLGGGWIASSA